MEEAAFPQLRRSHMAEGSHARGNSAKRKSDGRPGRSEHDKRQRLLFQTYDAVRLRLQRWQHRVAGLCHGQQSQAQKQWPARARQHKTSIRACCGRLMNLVVFMPV